MDYLRVSVMLCSIVTLIIIPFSALAQDITANLGDLDLNVPENREVYVKRGDDVKIPIYSTLKALRDGESSSTSLAGLSAQLNLLSDTVVQEISDRTEDVDDSIEALDTSLTEKINALDTSLRSELQGVNEDITQEMELRKSAVSDLRDTLMTKIESEGSVINATIDALGDTINKKVDDSKIALSATIASNKEDCESKIGTTKSNLEMKIDSMEHELMTVNASASGFNSKLQSVSEDLVELRREVEAGAVGGGSQLSEEVQVTAGHINRIYLLEDRLFTLRRLSREIMKRAQAVVVDVKDLNQTAKELRTTYGQVEATFDGIRGEVTSHLGVSLTSKAVNAGAAVTPTGTDLQWLTDMENRIKQLENQGTYFHECEFSPLNSDADSGHIASCTYEKKKDDTVLYIQWTGNLRVICDGCARIWKFLINGQPCDAGIDTSLHETANDNYHRVSTVGGFCTSVGSKSLPKGIYTMTWSTSGDGDSYTGWNSNSRIIVEEHPPSPQMQ